MNSAAAVAPVQITMQIVNGEVRCGPRTIRLPAATVRNVDVRNRAERPIWFVAPKFFEAAHVGQSTGFAFDLTEGGFLAAPKSTVRMQVTTPPTGEYYFSCFEQAAVPTLQSSGFLLVAPAKH